jgi:hypothetical protein
MKFYENKLYNRSRWNLRGKLSIYYHELVTKWFSRLAHFQEKKSATLKTWIEFTLLGAIKNRNHMMTFDEKEKEIKLYINWMNTHDLHERLLNKILITSFAPLGCHHLLGYLVISIRHSQKAHDDAVRSR